MKTFFAILQSPLEVLMLAVTILSCRLWVKSKLHVPADVPGSSSTVMTAGSRISVGWAGSAP
jgi:hypothetical protein